MHCIKDVGVKAVHSELIMFSSIQIASRFIRYMYLWDTPYFQCYAANTLLNIVDISLISQTLNIQRNMILFSVPRTVALWISRRHIAVILISR